MERASLYIGGIGLLPPAVFYFVCVKELSRQ
jgi:hypothetical protein